MFKSLQDRPLSIFTPLGPDVLTLRRFNGVSAVSELFQFELELEAPRPGIREFDKVLGQPAVIRIRQVDGALSYFHGLVSRLEWTGQDRTHLRYRALLVPRLWLLSKSIQSRIFQHQSVLEVLQTVLQPLRPDFEFKLQRREYYQRRDYCVQYQESDFAFASRLMEEEGLFYYFEHSDEGHKLVVTDSHTLLPAPEELADLTFDDGATAAPETVRVNSWNRRQDVCSSNFTFWDQHFELPDSQGRGFQILEAKKRITDKVKTGQTEHNLGLEVSRPLEVYDCQPGYAKCFDSIAPNGSERTDQLSKVYETGRWRVTRRAEAEAAAAFRCGGSSNIAQLHPGDKFKLAGLLDDSGQYYLLRVEHEARLGDASRSGGHETFHYENRFECLPAELPYRPPCTTPRPAILGVQTATVVGTVSGESNAAPHLDKYGRVRVQFHWDRERKFDSQSSCWLRVAQVWAGQRFGAFFWPRPGHEVVVSFENGDPDCPLVTGSVYNAVNMPPLPLPEGRHSCGFKSYTPGGEPHGEFNCLVFHDEPGFEYLQADSSMHELSRSHASRAIDTSGPTLMTCGRASLPVPGSGSGSGATESETPPPEAEEQARPSGSAPKLGSLSGLYTFGGGERGSPGHVRLSVLGDWKGSTKRLINNSTMGLGFSDSFPARSEYSFGDSFEVSLFGKKVEHQIWGDEQKFAFAHPIDLLESIAQSLVAKLEIGELLLKAYKYAMWGLKLLPEPSGNFELLLGKKTEFGYYGPFYDVKRGKKYEYQGKKFSYNSDEPMGKAAFWLTVLIYTTMSAADILGRKFHTLNDEGEVKGENFWIANANVVANKVAGILAELEIKNAKAQQGIEDAERAANAASAAATATAVPIMEAAVAQLEEATRGLRDTAEDLMDVTGVRNPSDASTRHVHVYEDRYSLTAPELQINARESQGVAPVITVSATDDNGQVLVECGGGDNAGIFLMTQSANSVMLSSGGIELYTPSSNKIELQVGMIPSKARIEMTSDEMTMECGLLGGSSIKFTPSSLELKVGPAASITLEQTGITLKMGDANTVTLGPDGVSINGIQLNFAATATASLEGLQVSVSGQAAVNVSGAITQLG